MSDEFTQYEIKNAWEKIHSYYLPRPNESRKSAIIRAKHEYIDALKRYIAVAEAITESMLEIVNEKDSNKS
jgi:hypothetical protein